MIYEAQVSYVRADEKGQDRNIKESFVIDNAETFAEVEERLYKEFDWCATADVVAIKRSRIKEIANTRNLDDELLWLAEMQSTFIEEDGSEKTTKYKVIFFSTTFDTAKHYIAEYAKQGYGLDLVSLKLTKFIDVL